ncbi:MAG: hypothetical protein QW343_03055 [Candidatus Norongarragalinales archaeon]
MKKTLFFIAVVSVLTSFSVLVRASHLLIVDPVKLTAVAGSEINLGLVGPGQKLEIVALRETGEDARGITYKSEALWDKIFVARETLPLGWSAEDAKFYEQPMHAFVTVASDAEDGEYSFKIRTLDEYEGIEPIEITVKVTVSREVLDATLEQKTISTGVEHPALYFLRLKNKSSASDAVLVTVQGLPSTQRLTQKAFLRHNSETMLPIELSEKERGDYALSFKAESLSSPFIFAEDRSVLVVYSSLWNDLLAVANGILLFPTAEQPIHAGLGLIARLLS